MVVYLEEIETWKNKYLEKGLSESLLLSMLAEIELEWNSQIYISDNPAKINLKLIVSFDDTSKLPENIFWGFIHLFLCHNDTSILVKSILIKSIVDLQEFIFSNINNLTGDYQYWGEILLFGYQDDENFILIDEFGWNVNTSLETTTTPDENYYYPLMNGSANETDVMLGLTFYKNNPYEILTGTYEIPPSDIYVLNCYVKTAYLLNEMLDNNYSYSLFNCILTTSNIQCIGSIV